MFRQHYGQMIWQAKRILNDEEESRDVVSEFFATLIKMDILPKNIEGYLMTSVRNRCLNLLDHKDVRAQRDEPYSTNIYLKYYSKRIVLQNLLSSKPFFIHIFGNLELFFYLCCEILHV